MARRAVRADSLVALRRLLRGLHKGARPGDPGRAELRRSIEIALFRLSKRQREIMRRYDLCGEPAPDIQRALGISRRQFFRDRRAALTVLLAHVSANEGPTSAWSEAPAVPARSTIHICDVTLSRRAFARSLAQAGSAQCLDVMRDLCVEETDARVRADLLLELADRAADYDDDVTARNAVGAVSPILSDPGVFAPALRDQLSGRLALCPGAARGNSAGGALILSSRRGVAAP